MKIRLINYTGIGNPNPRFAAELLAFTKSTRLKMSPSLMDEIQSWSEDKLNEELEYMSNTIPSSWEFVDYTFLLEGCTRAFTHQLVRNRHGSYAQQTMRILDVSGFGYEVGPSIECDQNLLEDYCDTMATLNEEYKSLIEKGAAVEDARGVLPTNIHTNIVVKFNLRTLAEIVSKRSSPRTQGEYRQFVEGLADGVLEVHPWAKAFLRNRKHEAAAELDDFISKTFEMFDGYDYISDKDKMSILKLVDILRG